MKKSLILLLTFILILFLMFFIVYYFNTNTKWIITQYGDNIGEQMMSFTIEGNNNGLLIIDGGYKDNEDQYSFLLNKIQSNNNIVDCWIITHLDSDHVGAFLRIINDKDIQINRVIVQDAPSDLEILKENAPWDEDWDCYNEFMSLNLQQINKVHSGDEFNNIIGLKMKVLSSYDDWIDEKTNNLLNNGSVVFKLYGNKESALFTGDIQSKEIGDYLIETYGDELKADYLQVPHHGNNYMSEDFYKIVKPKVAFFSAPDWLINNEGHVDWYTAPKNKELLENLGANILWHNTSPNIVTMH